MKFSIPLAISGLAASSLAAPSLAALRRATKQPNVQYNDIWAGSVLNNGGKDEYTTVYGEFVVPEPARATAGDTSVKAFKVSTWIGIDGSEANDSPCPGLWQAGVDSALDQNGKMSYEAWYEWYPLVTQGFSNMPVKAGDVISVRLHYSSYTQGTVTMVNKSTGKKETKTVSSSYALCGKAAEWIVEHLPGDDAGTGLAKFGNVTFNNAYALVMYGTTVPGALYLLLILG